MHKNFKQELDGNKTSIAALNTTIEALTEKVTRREAALKEKTQACSFLQEKATLEAEIKKNILKDLGIQKQGRETERLAN